MKKQHLFLLTISLMLSTFSFSQVIHNEAFKLSNSFGDFKMRRYISGDLTYRRALVPSYNATTKTASLLINYAGDFTDGVRIMGTKIVFDGKVGIGTTNPSEKLHVDGTLGVGRLGSYYTEGLKIKYVDGGSGTTTFKHNRWGGYFHFKRSSSSGERTQFVFGGSSNHFMDIYNNNNEVKVRLNSGGHSYFNGGNVGIGTTNPNEKLHVNGLIKINKATSEENNSPGLTLASNDDFLYDGQYINHYGFGFHGYQDGTTSFVEPSNSYISGYFGIDFFSSGENRMRISRDGIVSIGTVERPTGYKLAVAGNIISEEVKVKLKSSGWPDYVFEKNYPLPSLKSVEHYINQYGHLQDIPSSKEVANNGIFLGDMNAKLLQKIEELTLYTIQQQKELEAQQQKNKNLEARLTALEAHLKN